MTCTPDESLFNETDPKENERYYRYMKQVGFRERIITNRAYSLFAHGDKNVYRWLPENVLGTIAYGVYADRVAFGNWKTRELMIIRSKSLAATFRGQFEFLWSQAKSFA